MITSATHRQPLPGIEIPYAVVDPGPDSPVMITLALAGRYDQHSGTVLDEVLIRVRGVETGALHSAVSIPVAVAGRLADQLAAAPAHAAEAHRHQPADTH